MNSRLVVLCAVLTYIGSHPGVSVCSLFFQDPLLDLEQQMGTPVGGGRGSGGKVLQRPSAAVKMDAGTAGAEAAILVSVREQRGTVRRFSSSRYMHLNVYLKPHC